MPKRKSKPLPIPRPALPTAHCPPPTPPADDVWDADGLNPRRRAFVEHLCGPCMGDQTAAARAAGYSGDDATLAQAGSRLVNDAKVQQAIGRYWAARGVTREWLANNLATRARASLSNFLTLTPMGPVIDWPKAWAAGAIDQIKEWTENVGKEGVSYKLKLHDPVKASETLARLLGLMVEKTQDVSKKGVEEMSDEELARELEAAGFEPTPGLKRREGAEAPRHEGTEGKP